MASQIQQADQVRPFHALRLPQVLEKTGLSRSTLFRLAQQHRFPHSHKLTERVAVWDAAAIDAWLAEKFGAGTRSTGGVK